MAISLKGRVSVNIYKKSKELWKSFKMFSGSFPIFAFSNHTTFSQTQTGATVPLNINNVKKCSMSTRQVSSGRPTNALSGSPGQPFSNQNWYYNAKIADTYAGGAWFSLPVRYRPAPGSAPKVNKTRKCCRHLKPHKLCTCTLYIYLILGEVYIWGNARLI
jgi:hypothetical protein